MVHPCLDAGSKRKNWYKVGPLVQVQITCPTSPALLSFENCVPCVCFKSMHFQRKLCQTVFVLTTTLPTDQPHLLASREPPWHWLCGVAAGGCGTRQPALALMSLSPMALAALRSCTSVCLCVTGWKNWKGPGNMRAIGRAPSRCDITLLTPPFFSVSTRDILQARDGEKQNIPPALRLLLLLQCYWLYYYYMYNSIFFTYLFFPLTWFRMESDNSYGIMNYKGVRVGRAGKGGAGHLLHGIFCTFSWIALSFLDTKRGTAEGTAGHVCRDLKRRERRPQQKISEDRKTMQKHSGL